jgi:hypothetical protein
MSEAKHRGHLHVDALLRHGTPVQEQSRKNFGKQADYHKNSDQNPDCQMMRRTKT